MPGRQAETPAAGQRPPGRVGRARRALLWPSLALLVGLLAGWAAEPVRVSGPSMEPTLRSGQWVLLVHARVGPLGRGDVVVLRSPAGGRAVKRVAAVAGDQVELRGGVLVVDGRPVPEPYADRTGTDGVWFGPATVPPGSVFVLGDRRAASRDSLDYGPVRTGDVLGRVVG